MMRLSPDQWVNMIASGVAATACAAFAVVYHLRAPWWRSAVGRNLMLLAGALGGLCLYTVLIIMWPDGCPAVALRGLRTAMVLAIAVLMVQRARMVVRAQRADKS
ncbi:putative phage holin [Streptomyces goshikiensis]|uniref:putative phage holin n=1 Tax=Streptomyces goshikiensis TaxID=1942 RepID=UPI0036A5DCF0